MKTGRTWNENSLHATVGIISLSEHLQPSRTKENVLLSKAMMTHQDIRPAKARVAVSVGESVRIVRELQGLTQGELARRTKIPQSTISAIENDTINLGVERAKTLARVLQCHPAVLVFPGWDVTKQSAA
jgi:ribosome-binding protein aMBF1 (putative translation factor)